MSEESQEDKRAQARKHVRLLMARGEFAEARSARMLGSMAEEASELRLACGEQMYLDRHAFRSRTLLDAERMLQADIPSEVVLGDVFERYATRALIASDVMVELKTYTACLLVGGEFCRWIMAVTAELLHAIESTTDRSVGCRASVTIDHEEGVGIVMRITSLGGSSRPVPTATGLAAIERTGRLMRLFGRFRQDIEGGDLVYVATFAGCTANEID